MMLYSTAKASVQLEVEAKTAPAVENKPAPKLKNVKNVTEHI